MNDARQELVIIFTPIQKQYWLLTFHLGSKIESSVVCCYFKSLLSLPGVGTARTPFLSSSSLFEQQEPLPLSSAYRAGPDGCASFMLACAPAVGEYICFVDFSQSGRRFTMVPVPRSRVACHASRIFESSLCQAGTQPTLFSGGHSMNLLLL